MERQQTLIALYGDKPRALAELIETVQAELASAAGTAFRAYRTTQVHATLCGLERATDSGSHRWFAELRGEQRETDVRALGRWLRGQLPLRARIAGYPEQDAGFSSRGRRPFERSFQIANGIAVLIGWPVRHGELDTLRRGCQQWGALHRYHGRPEDYDDDLYMRLGLVDRSFDATEVEREVRALLAARAPVALTIGAADAGIASYVDETLPPDSTDYSPLPGV